MSVGSMLAGGFRLVRTQPGVVAIWAVLYAIAAAVGMIAMRPLVGSMMAFQQEAAARAAAGIKAPPVLPAGAFGELLLVEIVALALLVIAFAAVVRAVIRPGGDRFAYLRLGMDELRLFGLGVLFVIAAIGAEIVAAIVLGLIAAAAVFLIGAAAAVAVAVVLGLALFAAAIWAEVRLSLAGALTVMRGHIVIGEAWRATRGRFWTLFGAYLLLWLVFMVVGVALLAVTNPGLIGAYASMDPQAINAAGQAQLARQAAGLSGVMVVQLIVGAFVGVAMGAVAIGAVATAALELTARPDAGEIFA